MQEIVDKNTFLIIKDFAMKQIDEYNVLAIELIEYLGNDKPRQEQIDLMEYLVTKVMKATVTLSPDA